MSESLQKKIQDLGNVEANFDNSADQAKEKLAETDATHTQLLALDNQVPPSAEIAEINNILDNISNDPALNIDKLDSLLSGFPDNVKKWLEQEITERKLAAASQTLETTKTQPEQELARAEQTKQQIEALEPQRQNQLPPKKIIPTIKAEDLQAASDQGFSLATTYKQFQENLWADLEALKPNIEISKPTTSEQATSKLDTAKKLASNAADFISENIPKSPNVGMTNGFFDLENNNPQLNRVHKMIMDLNLEKEFEDWKKGNAEPLKTALKDEKTKVKWEQSTGKAEKADLTTAKGNEKQKQQRESIYEWDADAEVNGKGEFTDPDANAYWKLVTESGYTGTFEDYLDQKPKNNIQALFHTIGKFIKKLGDWGKGIFKHVPFLKEVLPDFLKRNDELANEKKDADPTLDQYNNKIEEINKTAFINRNLPTWQTKLTAKNINIKAFFTPKEKNVAEILNSDQFETQEEIQNFMEKVLDSNNKYATWGLTVEEIKLIDKENGDIKYDKSQSSIIINGNKEKYSNAETFRQALENMKKQESKPKSDSNEPAPNTEQPTEVPEPSTKTENDEVKTEEASSTEEKKENTIESLSEEIDIPIDNLKEIWEKNKNDLVGGPWSEIATGFTIGFVHKQNLKKWIEESKNGKEFMKSDFKTLKEWINR